MNNPFVKSVLPHIAVVILFSILTYVYLLPVLQGKELAQHDITQSLSMSHEVRSIWKETGELPLWTNSMFGGMPSYQIWMDYPSNVVTHCINFIKIFFPDTPQYVFLCMLCMYILLFVYTRNHWIGIIGGIAFAFGTFNIISLDAGHTSKVRCIAFMAAILAGIVSAYRGRYLFGAALVALVLGMQIRSNHFQISYYTFMSALVLGVYFLVMAIRGKKMLNFLKATGILLIAAMLAVGANAAQLWVTYEYSNATIRGGKSELAHKAENQAKEGGLDKDYAFSWSYGKLETFTLLIPNFMGGASSEELSENSNLYEEFTKKGVPRQQAKGIMGQVPTYWGDQPFTAGPTYYGAVICFLFVLGMFVVKSPLKWAFFALGALMMLLGWGRNLMFFNELFFNYFPMYNKFRTPSMALVVTNLSVIFIAGLGVHEVINGKLTKQEIFDGLKKSVAIILGIILLVGIGGSFMFDFKAAIDSQLTQSGWPVDALRQDRAALLRADAIRSFIFIAIAALLVWGFIEKKIKQSHLLAGITLLVLVDLWQVCKRYLNEEDFVTKSAREKMFQPSKTDLQILQDKDPYYRVLNLTTSTFNDAKTSYFHKSVGGYHAAKLRRYQELIEKQITKNMARLNKGLGNDNIPVLNMLNMKYVIASKDDVIRNPNAMGNAWFVSSYRLVENADEEINALSNFNPAELAIIDQRFKDYLAGLPSPTRGTGTIELKDYHPNRLKYESNSGEEQLAVFSEIYYDEKKDWKVFIDGKPIEHIRVNYVLRALRIPEGKHTIEFKFEPRSYYTGENISLAFSSLTLLLVLLTVVVEVRKSLRGTRQDATQA